MKIVVPKESDPREQRVALTPDAVRGLLKKGFTCAVEADAGAGAYFLDDAYRAAGAEVVPDFDTLMLSADVVLKVNAPTTDEARRLRPGATLISFLYAYTVPEVLAILQERRVNAFAMDAVPRISRAQKMDALSSQANLAGYKAVLLGANALGRIFPLMMTAAGTVTPAKVLIFGAGVAGLQAIATARRLGAVVEVTDVRPETKEQVESLGGRFLEVEGEGITTEGGYAREVSAEYLKRQQAMVARHVADADLVITTALVIGKRAPLLVSEETVRQMRPGAVIVDMAVASGGNCALSERDRTVVKHHVTIIGESNLPARLAVHASELYAKNLTALLLHLTAEGAFKWEEEEVTQGALIVRDGALVHAFTKEILAKTTS
ncbi:MAG: Re/Si-specific NAD(P)(+) transhydrogenase subunit alpha [Catalinimonas sp.]